MRFIVHEKATDTTVSFKASKANRTLFALIEVIAGMQAAINAICWAEIAGYGEVYENATFKITAEE